MRPLTRLAFVVLIATFAVSGQKLTEKDLPELYRDWLDLSPTLAELSITRIPGE